MRYQSSAASFHLRHLEARPANAQLRHLPRWHQVSTYLQKISQIPYHIAHAELANELEIQRRSVDKKCDIMNLVSDIFPNIIEALLHKFSMYLNCRCYIVSQYKMASTAHRQFFFLKIKKNILTMSETTKINSLLAQGPQILTKFDGWMGCPY